MEDIGKRIKEARKNNKLSQTELAYKISMDNSQFSKVENGKLLPTIFQIVELSSILGISIDWLLVGKEPKQMFSGHNFNEDRESYKKLIPLYNDVSTIGGKKQVANLNPVSSPTEYIDAGDWFPGASAAIRHYDESMLEYPNGCILALKKVNDKTQIVWGKNYCVETDEFRVSKKLQHRDGDKHVWGYSTNLNTYPDGSLIHQPIPIDPDRINKLWLILGCVRKEYSSGVVFVHNGDN